MFSVGIVVHVFFFRIFVRSLESSGQARQLTGVMRITPENHHVVRFATETHLRSIR